MLSVIMLSVIMLSVILLSVIMLNVMTPENYQRDKRRIFSLYIKNTFTIVCIIPLKLRLTCLRQTLSSTQP